MKKKGLIVATIVMVLVLAVSLSTATYAWFTNTGSANVDTIEFSVAAASDLVIGVSKTNKWVEGQNWSAYTSDQTEYTASSDTWTGSTDGLGLQINTGLDLKSMTKAVYSFTGVTYDEAENTKITAATQTAYAKDAQATTAIATGLDRNGTILKASGSGDSISKDSWETAVKNTDYLDVVFGVAASKPDVLNFGCLISVDNITTEISSLGMNAAIHVLYSTDGTNYKEIDIYSNKTAGDAIDSVTAPTMPTAKIADKTVTYEGSKVTYANGDAQLWIPLRNASTSTDYATTGAAGIQQLHLIIYICGPDSDCSTAATGAAANITIEFLDINASHYTNAQ